MQRTESASRFMSGPRLVALVVLIAFVAVPAVTLVESRAVLRQWPYVPVRFTGDDLRAVLELEGRSGAADSAFVGLAARSACPPNGPVALVLPIDVDTLHPPIQYKGTEIPWINQRLVDDLVAAKVEHAAYEPGIDPQLVDPLVAEGALVSFSAAVLAPPAGSVSPDSRLVVYYLERDDVFVLLPSAEPGGAR